MFVKTPVVIIAGYLGSGKTTLLRRLIEKADRRLAILINEFGELSIDSQIVSGKNIKIAELPGGCVCCSLIGEFEAAVNEIIETVRPDEIVVETTGVAEPDALIMDIQENLHGVIIDAVVTIVDAEATLRFPSIGYTGRVQIEMADLILLNKMDLIPDEQRVKVRGIVQAIHPSALLLETVQCQVDTSLIFGQALQLERKVKIPSEESHTHPMESFQVTFDQTLKRDCFEKVIQQLPEGIYRAKGFIQLEQGTFLLNFVAGRWELEPWPEKDVKAGLVFIGEGALALEKEITAQLKDCGLQTHI
jgi:G3E family GTPase